MQWIINSQWAKPFKLTMILLCEWVRVEKENIEKLMSFCEFIFMKSFWTRHCNEMSNKRSLHRTRLGGKKLPKCKVTFKSNPLGRLPFLLRWIFLHNSQNGSLIWMTELFAIVITMQLNIEQLYKYEFEQMKNLSFFS